LNRHGFIGAEAARLLFARLHEGPKKRVKRIVLQPELIVRGSAAAPAGYAAN